MHSNRLDLGKYNTDKITLRYLEWYDPILESFVPNEVKLLEIGIYAQRARWAKVKRRG
jgi:hypothetical protein